MKSVKNGTRTGRQNVGCKYTKIIREKVDCREIFTFFIESVTCNIPTFQQSNNKGFLTRERYKSEDNKFYNNI